MNNLIKSINYLCEASYESTGTVYKSDVIDLINEAMEGKVIVPVEPTDEMLEAAVSVVWASGEGMRGVVNHFDKIYKAMLSTIRTSGE